METKNQYRTPEIETVICLSAQVFATGSAASITGSAASINELSESDYGTF